MMDVSVIIINWHSAAYALACIESIIGKTKRVSIEIIVADNGSFDGLESKMRERSFNVKFLQFDENLGFARANNRAARSARGRYFLFLNPDTLLESNAVDAMVHFLDRHHEIGAVGPRLLGRDGRIQCTSAWTFPTPFRQFCQLAMLDRLFPKQPFFSSAELRYWDHLDSRPADCISGACFFIRRELFERLDGFDERLFMYAEDVDLCYRLQQTGYKIYYMADERVFHAGGGTSENNPTRDRSIVVMQRAATEYFIRKHFGRRKAVVFRSAVGVGAVVRITVAAAFTILGKLRSSGIASHKRALGKYGALLLWVIGLRKTRALV